jgi:plastocyanin
VYPGETLSYSDSVARIARLSIAVAAAALALPGIAQAKERTLTFTTPAISVPAYGVKQQPMYAESPSIDGYVVGMEAEVVDAAGRVQGRDKVMLHHIVFAKVGVPDYTCGGGAERFFAEGEERLALSLPRGYGYANKATDRWGLLYMLMNHKKRPLKGFIRYTVRYVTGEALTPAKPVWLDVRNCTGGIDPVFDVPGGGKRFSTFTRTADFTMPESGRLISGGGHLHGGGVRLELRNATCGTVPFTSRPTWGGPKPKPLLHEPGPTKMSSFRSTEGIPVAIGQKLRLAAVYENQAPHTRVMGIMLLFLAPGAPKGCSATPPLEIDLGKPTAPPPFSMPLPRTPKGPVSNATSTIVGDFQYGSERISLKRGTTFTWRFLGQFQHDVTVVGGPEGFSAPWSLAGVFKHRFTKAGTYRLFCSLHPARMVQQITVH